MLKIRSSATAASLAQQAASLRLLSTALALAITAAVGEILMIGYEVDASAAIAKLTRLASAISNPDGVMAQIGQFGVEQLDETWQAESDPYGAGWAALAPSTLRQKAGPSILIESGSMNAGLGYQAGGDQVEIGVSSPIVKYHQDGTSKMPARPVVPDEGLPPDWEPRIVDLIESYIGGFS